MKTRLKKTDRMLAKSLGFISKIALGKDEPFENIVTAIKEDHDALKKFIKVMKDQEADMGEKREAFKGFSSLLKSHSASEEKALYTRILKIADLAEEAEEGYVEHELASSLLKKIMATRSEVRWSAQVKVVAELVEHHINEEESDMLPKISKYFPKPKQAQMTHEFIELRKETQETITQDSGGVLAVK